jgi:hypothetical protein
MGDSMVSFGNLLMLAPKPSRMGWLVKMGNSMKMLPMAYNPFKEFWFS